MAVKERGGGPSVVMTDEQIDRLPNVCRIIVRHARDIEKMCCAAVVSFDQFKKQRDLMRSYVRDAAKLYMPLSKSDGPATSPA